MKFSVVVLGADPSLIARLTGAANRKLAAVLASHAAARTGIDSLDDPALASAASTAPIAQSPDLTAGSSAGDALDISPDT